MMDKLKHYTTQPLEGILYDLDLLPEVCTTPQQLLTCDVIAEFHAENERLKTKYAADAISEMISGLELAGTDIKDIVVCLVGAGNVLEKADDTICKKNIESVTGLLRERNIPVRKSVLGGIKRRSLYMDTASGSIYYSEGGGEEKLLWEPEKEK